MSGHFVNIKPLSVNESIYTYVVGKGNKAYAKIGKTAVAKNFHKNLFYLLPPVEDIIIYDKITLFCNVSFVNQASDLDNCLKYFIDTLQDKYGFNDKLIFKIVAKKFLVTDKEQEGFRFKMEEFKEDNNV